MVTYWPGAHAETLPGLHAGHHPFKLKERAGSINNNRLHFSCSPYAHQCRSWRCLRDPQNRSKVNGEDREWQSPEERCGKELALDETSKSASGQREEENRVQERTKQV